MAIKLTQKSADIISINSKKTPSKCLSTHVREAIEYYFSELDGHETGNLHAMVIAEIEKPLIEATLKHCQHNQSKASKILGLSRSTLRKKIALYNLS